ncbi:lipid II flippase Amj family protein [Fusibacter paucivorans]|uniref:Lipid II flippase Amj n=1 Tax=Fusibacter paucivorans TaxID=76009 RepID=A0ABS5PUG8_9FIRM|nr:lipid II flippase Amj family protein [Fusibacter paucivorans]MBS7528502.1 lipid II flippase Amj family protein [Fusibacter paucivorans]
MSQIIVVFILTVVIHFINTLAYAVRIVGIRTGRIAISFALFNIVVLVSRIANTVQAPLLAKTVENSINGGFAGNLMLNFRYILLAATVGTILAALFIPTFQRLYAIAVEKFNVYKSVPRLLLHSFSRAGVKQFSMNLKVPSRNNLTQLKTVSDFPVRMTVLNTLAVAMLTVGVLASLYAGVLAPAYRTTASTLSSVITGLSTILLFVFIDPQLSIMTDEVLEGEKSEGEFRRTVTFMVFGRVMGTMLAQVMLFPAAHVIAYIASNVI